MTIEEFAVQLGRSSKRVEFHFRGTMREIGRSAVAFGKERMIEEIYAIPEDRTKSGRKKWTRTRRLYKSERAEVVDAYTVKIVNDAPYSEPRHEAGKPGRRNINPVRESHWRDEMLEAFEPIMTDLVDVTVERILTYP